MGVASVASGRRPVFCRHALADGWQNRGEAPSAVGFNPGKSIMVAMPKGHCTRFQTTLTTLTTLRATARVAPTLTTLTTKPERLMSTNERSE
jgi:hypothetical protein